MSDQTATIDREEARRVEADARRPGPKFTHASGSRPLDGYTIKRGVGVGGFGEVYFATSDGGKDVALKRIQRNLDVEMRGVRQCLNLKHANLVSLFDIKYDDHGEGWVVMEYIAGESLAQVLDRNPNGLPESEVRRWFRGLVEGVAYLHDYGIVHRDMKPANVFLDGEVVKIGDYGLSKFISCSRRSGQTESVGTFHYMAPEIGKGVYGKEIDIYALGIILHELLTGRVPFDGETGNEIIMKHLTAEPDLNAVREPYRSVIRRALLKDPEQRFSNAAEMLVALRFDDRSAPPDDVLFIGPETVPEPVSADMKFGPMREIPPRRSPSVIPVAVPVATSDQPAEPIAAAVRGSVQQARNWWDNAGFSGPVRVLLAIGAGILLLVNSEWLLPLAIALGAMYLVYYGVRSLVLALAGPPVPVARSANESPVAGVPVATPVRGEPPRQQNLRRRLNRREIVRQHLAERPASDRLTELFGSLLVSVVITLVLTLVMLIVGNQSLTGGVRTGTFFAWFAMTAIAGAWTVLVLGKLWEDSDGEAVQRRFVLLVGGLAVGALACFASDLLLLDLPSYGALRVGSAAGGTFYTAEGAPRLAAFLAYFGGLFLLLRWWHQADPARDSRLSVMSTGGCVLAAWILHQVWQMPQPWSVMLAATISIAVQMSAPWVNPKKLA